MTEEQKKVADPTPIEQMQAAGHDLWCIGKLMCAMEDLAVNEEVVAWLGAQCSGQSEKCRTQGTASKRRIPPWPTDRPPPATE